MCRTRLYVHELPGPAPETEFPRQESLCGRQFVAESGALAVFRLQGNAGYQFAHTEDVDSHRSL